MIDKGYQRREDENINRSGEKSCLVTLTFSRKRLARDRAITGKRHIIEIFAQRDMLANIINVGGGNIEDFPLSNRANRNAGAKEVSECAAYIKVILKT